MHLSVLVAFATALAVVVAIPGPGIFAVVSCALGRGFREALALIVGVVIGDLIYFTLAVFGMAALARSLGGLFLLVKLAGAAYLVWLGIKLWRQPPAAMAADVEPAARRGFRRSLLGGLFVTLSNPKAIAFYAGLLPTFVDLEKLSAGEALAMGGIVVVIVGTIPAAYAFAAAGSRRLLTHPSRLKLMNRAAAAMMIGTGLAVVRQ
ncbi:MAG TPA: LysE family translocator [Lacunisphaera sp.]|nr:LysE family translocator [Lacunisphaera sp.]